MQILQHWIIMAWRQKWLKQYKDVNLLNLDANPTTLDHHGMASEMAKTIQRRKLIEPRCKSYNTGSSWRGVRNG